MRTREDHEHHVHDIRRAEDDPSCWPASFKRNEFPAPHRRRLQLVRVLDGRSLTEWARASLSQAADRVLVEGGAVLRMRPDSPIYRASTPGQVGAPVAYSLGGERVWILHRADGLPPELSRDPTYRGGGYWCDLTPEQGDGGVSLRRVIVLESDVVPSEPARDGLIHAQRVTS